METREAQTSFDKGSAQAGPVVGEEDGVGRIRGVVFDAGVLAGGDAAEMSLLFEAGDVLGGFVGHAGNRVGVVEKLLRAVRGRCAMFAEWRGLLLGVLSSAGMIHDFEDLAFDDAADAIEVSAALALDF